MSGPRWVCPRSWHVFSQSTLLMFQVALQGNCLKQALGCVYFPGLRCSGSGSWVLHKAQIQLGLHFVPFLVFGEGTLPVWRCILLPPQSQLLGFLGAPGEHRLRCAMCLLWGADVWLQPSWQMPTVQDPRKTWLATRSLLTVWWRMPSLGPTLPLIFWLWFSPACLSASGKGRGWSRAG